MSEPPERRIPVRTDLIGRNAESAAHELELLRKMSPEERLAIALDLIDSMEFWRKSTESLRPALERLNSNSRDSSRQTQLKLL